MMNGRKKWLRCAAWVLTMILLFQALPLGAAEGWNGFNEGASGVLHSPARYTVRFLLDGETVETLFVPVGSPIGALPEAPQRALYTFEGWFDGDTAVDADFVPTGDTTLTGLYALLSPDQMSQGEDALDSVNDGKSEGGSTEGEIEAGNPSVDETTLADDTKDDTVPEKSDELTETPGTEDGSADEGLSEETTSDENAAIGKQTDDESREDLPDEGSSSLDNVDNTGHLEGETTEDQPMQGESDVQEGSDGELTSAETADDGADKTGEEDSSDIEPNEQEPDESGKDPDGTDFDREVAISCVFENKFKLGEEAELDSALYGFENDENIAFQWECDTGDGNGFTPVEGAVNDRWSYTITAESLSWNWRLIVTFDVEAEEERGAIVSDTLTVAAAKVEWIIPDAYDGGIESLKETYYMRAGAPLDELPKAPEIGGYSFVEWRTEKGEVVTEQTMVTEDACFYAYYKPLVFYEAIDGLSVEIFVGEEALPADARFHMRPLDGENYRVVAESVLSDEISSVFAVDMGFIDEDGAGIAPKEKVAVSMTLSDAEDADRIAVIRISEDGRAELVYNDRPDSVTTRDMGEKKVLSFEADAFSVYVVVGILEKEYLASGGETYSISLGYSAQANIPLDAELEVKELPTEDFTFPLGAKAQPTRTASKAASLRTAKKATKEEAEEKTEIDYIKYLDISIMDGDTEIQPEAPVTVTVRLLDKRNSNDTIKVYHIVKETAEEVQSSTQEVDGVCEVSFEASGFSVYAIVGYTIEKRIQASDGNTYLITVSYRDDAGIPEGADLDVTEILQSLDTGETISEYDLYLDRTAQVLGLDTDSVLYARFFDIHIIDESGNVIQPAEGAAVLVSVRLEDWAPENEPKVVHFGEQTEVLTAEAHENAVSFEATGFSVYAIVDAPAPVQPELRMVANLTELASNAADNAFFLSVTRGGATNQYFKSSLNSKSCFGLSNGSIQGAAEWYLVPTGDGIYRVYTLAGSMPQYIANPSGNNAGLTEDTDSAAVFEISQAADGLFYFGLQGQNKWLQYSNGGGGIRFYTDKNNAGNCQITITYASTMEKDPYGLDGQSFGIAYHDESATSAALTAEETTVSGQQRLAGQKTVMKPDVLDNDGIMLVAQNSDIRTWIFESVREDKYYITTMVDGVKKHLTINGSSVTLTEEPDEAHSLIQAVPGTGANKGKWNFSAGGYSLNLPGTAEQGFNATSGSGATAWMNLVKKSVLDDDDFTLYTAKKISVSDPVNMRNGQQVVIYTRVWNDEAKKYEFYAVDHDGSLIRCYDVGGSIEWIGSKVNTALWDFTEYFNADGTVSYYYEFQNTQYDGYIAPQVSQDQILSYQTIGVNLNGRRYGENYSTIIAWDDQSYAYSGLKTENGQVVACALSEAQDFYFAVINPVEDQLTEVATIDNSTYGITMLMIDYNNPVRNANGGAANNTNGRDSGQTSVLGYDTNTAGLLSTKLEDNGYPLTNQEKTGKEETSLSELYNRAYLVNHLFISSIHNESGYFEYDSTQNFAHLNGGTFTVYDQLGAIGDYPGATGTGRHGQFMPYNDLVSGDFCVFTNTTDVLGHELSDLNPRKNEPLHNIGERRDVDYFFGMEVSASFTQTPSGLDAWGHDIIFEFSGDDDFWLYVDGELVLDLGGVHSAMTGKVNFRTGVVTSSRGNTTLYELFKKHYEERGETDIDQKLSEIFTLNENGQYVFKDYTNHDMKIFYMERGAGASNLHMRFNLAAVKPGSFILSKKLSGTDRPDNNLIEFPYQIYYYTRQDGGTVLHRLGENQGEAKNVFYQDTSTPIKYMDSFTPADGTAAYLNVFFLQPGQSAEVNMPDDVIDYYVVECGVNPDVYNHVYMNGIEITGEASVNPNRNDYTTTRSTLEDRPKVDWDNHVSEGAMRTLSITKKLYDVNGETPLHYPENQTLFSFRLYLGNENASEDQLPAAFLYPYCIKDAYGYYCRWDAGTQTFASLGIADYYELQAYLNTLTSAQQEAIVFVTSPNGSISKIPADYTVEVRDLIVGTHYKVEERDWEIPKGYTRRESDGYTRMDVNPHESQGTPISGTTHVDETPVIEIRNQKGWGLTVEKIWTDKDFMTHDPIYFAIYLDGKLVAGTVRQLPNDETEIYYFFDDLYDQTGYSHTFSEFVIREVSISNENPTVENGVVLDYGTVTPIEEGGDMAVGGMPTGGSYQSGYHYTVHYEVGESTGHNENVRIDKVTNSRPGIELYKTDWQGNALAGAVFTLKDETGADVSAETYVSGADGLITIAYPSEGVYTLTEIRAPKGYVVIDTPMTIQVSAGNEVTVTGIDESLYVIKESQNSMLVSIIVKDRTTSLQAIKVDAKTDEPLEGVSFALYRQVTDNDGNKRKDYRPMEGYTYLVTDEDGVIPQITMDLNPGTYYLTETYTLDDYMLLADDLCFTIGDDGTVTVETEAYQGWLSNSKTEGAVTYTLNIKNYKKLVDLVITKQVTGNMGDPSQEFEFTVKVDGKTTGFTVCKNGVNLSGNTFELKHGQSVTVKDVPINATVKVTETNTQGYTTRATLNDDEISEENINGNPSPSVSDDGAVTGGDEGKRITFSMPAPPETGGDTTLVVTNDQSMPPPPTGIRLERGAYMALIGLALMLGAALTVDQWKEKRRNRGKF